MRIDFGEPIEFEFPIADFPLQSIPIKSLAGRAEKKVFVYKPAYDEMIEHVNLDKNIECGGILVGYPFQDTETEEVFVVIVGVIRDLSDNRSVVHFTVTPDVISRTREILEEKYPKLIAVGWYHSHPGHGVFLSGQDMTIVRGIYNEDWNLAWVIDPIRNHEGIFWGKDGEPLVKNKSSNPLLSREQTWIPLVEYPKCIIDLQSEILMHANKKTDPQRKNWRSKYKQEDRLISKREEKKSKGVSKNIKYVFIGLGIASIIVFLLGVAIFIYMKNPVVNPTATSLAMPTIFTPIPSVTPAIELIPTTNFATPITPAYP